MDILKKREARYRLRDRSLWEKKTLKGASNAPFVSPDRPPVDRLFSLQSGYKRAIDTYVSAGNNEVLYIWATVEYSFNVAETLSM